MVRAAAAVVLLLLLGTINRLGVARPAPLDHHAVIRFESVALDASAPARARLDGLAYLGGWSLHSKNPDFGGISAMHVGTDVIALSDAGVIIRFPLPTASAGTLIGRLDLLSEGIRSRLKKSMRDTEALAIAGPLAWVGYERRNIIARFRTADWNRLSFARPAAMRRWPRNGGSEALVRFRDGRFLVFSEKARRPDGTTQLLLFDGDPAVAGTPCVQLGYRAPADYRATDAAELPDGRLLVLNRRFSLLGDISAKLVVARLPQAGDVLAGREIAAFAPPVTVDNMEALSVTEENGRTIVWIASDDNFSRPLQRTLLLKFALAY